MLLEQGGLREGWPMPPSPLAHCYNEEWDDTERAMLGYFDWRRTNLRDEDLLVSEAE